MELEKKRVQNGLTQKQVAAKMGVSEKTVCQWEKGVRRPNIDMLVKLTEVFGCTADELLGIERKKPDPEDETPRTREQEISVRMSEAFADARKRQEA